MSPNPELVCVPASEPMMISLRTFSGAAEMPVAANAQSGPEPSNWTVIFDCETRTDAAQQLRFGVYQVRNSRKLVEHGIFFDPNGIGPDEFVLLRNWTYAHNLSLISRTQFIEEVFLRYGYDLQGAITGFNLPFDLSRIAIGHGSARGDMRGGFSFQLSASSRRPRVQVKHLSARSARIRFTHPGKQLTPRGMRKRGIPVRPHRGFFVDLKTLASALTSGSYSLKSLGEFLGVNTQKLNTEEHRESLTPEYLEYAINDVQTTWECYCELVRRYQSHLLERTPAHRIMSEASLGKGYLREMGIRPWRQMQRDLPPEIIGRIMSAYYGGRSEIHIRRTATRVLYCDFLSMYPTVCTLMGLWKFVIADGMDWRGCTEETQAYLARIGISDLQEPLAWRGLATLVRIIPHADILPVRAPYEKAQKTIGLNYLSSDNSLWFTLADCIASKLLTGKAPKVIEAITFQAGTPQADLQSICIGGNPQYGVEPAQVDFYRMLIDRRNESKAQLKQAKRCCQSQSAKQLEAEQLALKILANSTSYGIFVEINVEERDAREPVTCYAADGMAFSVQTNKLEKPGTYFHPLLACLISNRPVSPALP